MSKNNKQKSKFFKPVFIGLCVILFAATIFFAVDTATSGAEISRLQSQIQELEKRNRELTSDVIKSSSVSTLDGGAEALGFVKPEKTVYLTIEDNSAAYAR
jgi:hypothetical protein